MMGNWNEKYLNEEKKNNFNTVCFFYMFCITIQDYIFLVLNFQKKNTKKKIQIFVTAHAQATHIHFVYDKKKLFLITSLLIFYFFLLLLCA